MRPGKQIMLLWLSHKAPVINTAQPAQLCSHKAIWEKIFMVATEMFLPKQHLHIARVIFSGEGFPYCCGNCLKHVLKSAGLQGRER